MTQARLMAREELLEGWGHGWEETWFIGDDEDPERIILKECVWIDSIILVQDFGIGKPDSDWWVEHYGRKHGSRVWKGENPPTEEQRENTPWTEKTI